MCEHFMYKCVYCSNKLEQPSSHQRDLILYYYLINNDRLKYYVTIEKNKEQLCTFINTELLFSRGKVAEHCI